MLFPSIQAIILVWGRETQPPTTDMGTHPDHCEANYPQKEVSQFSTSSDLLDPGQD